MIRGYQVDFLLLLLVVLLVPFVLPIASWVSARRTGRVSNSSKPPSTNSREALNRAQGSAAQRIPDAPAPVTAAGRAGLRRRSRTARRQPSAPAPAPPAPHPPVVPPPPVTPPPSSPGPCRGPVVAAAIRQRRVPRRTTGSPAGRQNPWPERERPAAARAPAAAARRHRSRAALARPPATRPPAPPPAPPQPPAPAFDWESLVGVKLFSAIAGIALVLAAVFFLRYSVEHGWLQPPVRVLIGIVVAMALLVVCELKAARRYPRDGQRARRRGDRDPVLDVLRRARAVESDSRVADVRAARASSPRSRCCCRSAASRSSSRCSACSAASRRRRCCRPARTGRSRCSPTCCC